MSNKFAGMTVNERLYVSGFMDQFDHAVKEKNTAIIITILKKVELKDESIDHILKQFELKR